MIGQRLIEATNNFSEYLSAFSTKSFGANSVGIAINGTFLSVGLNQAIFGLCGGLLLSLLACWDGLNKPNVPLNNDQGYGPKQQRHGLRKVAYIYR